MASRYPTLQGLGATRAKAAPAESRICFVDPAPTPAVGQKVSGADGVAQAMSYLARAVHEEMHVLPVDARLKIRQDHMVGRGWEGGVGMTVTPVARVVLLAGCTRYILVHNHPGGDPEFSSEDWMWTEKLMAAGRCAGLTLLDHIVVAWDEDLNRVVYRNMRDNDVLSRRYGLDWLAAPAK